MEDVLEDSHAGLREQSGWSAMDAHCAYAEVCCSKGTPSLSAAKSCCRPRPLAWAESNCVCRNSYFLDKNVLPYGSVADEVSLLQGQASTGRQQLQQAEKFLPGQLGQQQALRAQKLPGSALCR